MNTRSEQEHIEHILTLGAFNDWIMENYPVFDGDNLTELQEDVRVSDKYLREHGLPLTSEIKGL